MLDMAHTHSARQVIRHIEGRVRKGKGEVGYEVGNQRDAQPILSHRLVT
jgi:hypothetical protein